VRGIAPLDRHKFDAWYQILPSGKLPAEIVNDMWGHHDAEEYADEVTHWNSSKALCITEGGLMAMVPAKARSNDQIVILTGSPLPFVIRPINYYYTLIGICYLHDAMDGKAFPSEESGLEWVTLR
jgi:hypothetical protein